MRKKTKVYPPGTFIPLPQRVVAILQLCITISLILWYGTQPFMGEYFLLKSELLPYEYVMGTSTLLKKEGSSEKLERNKLRFEKLDLSTKHLIQKKHQVLTSYASRPVSQKILEGFKALLFGVPPFELTWIIMATVISIMVLKKNEGARKAAWLLPLLALIFSFDNLLNGFHTTAHGDEHLFPSESEIVFHYVKEPLDGNLSIQNKQLKAGWDSYLVEKWASHDEKTVENGEFNFTIARLENISINVPTQWSKKFNQKSNFLILALYFLWNLLFAFMVNRQKGDLLKN